LAAGFLAATFFAAGFLAATFFAAGFLATTFFATGFLATTFFAAGFLAAVFLAVAIIKLLHVRSITNYSLRRPKRSEPTLWVENRHKRMSHSCFYFQFCKIVP
jgi:hypothetical protein